MKTSSKPQASVRPNKSVKTNKSVRPPKSLTGYNPMKALLAPPSKILLILSILAASLFSSGASADEYVRMVGTNHYGQINFKKTLLIGAQLQLDQQELVMPPGDQDKFNQALVFLTSIEENKRDLRHRQKRFRRSLDCQLGYCQYTHGQTDFDDQQNPQIQTAKARFCANNPLAT